MGMAPGNRIPDQVSSIHMIAACGTGMGALACMLQDLGFTVTGSDQDIYPPMSDFLRDKGVRLFKGFSSDNLVPPPDLVIIGNAVVRTNPEAVAVMEGNIPYCSMPQALNRFVARDKTIIMVTGTHGKTTTSSLMAHVLQECGYDPSFMIGGIVKGFNSNYRLGQGDHIVIEGDEYDTAFFDKGPKFMHYRSGITIVNGIEFDHADIFRDFDHVRQVFEDLVRSLPEKGLILANHGDEVLRAMMKAARPAHAFFGEQAPGWSYENYRIEHGMSVADISTPGGDRFCLASPLMGKHNMMNCLAVVAASRELGIEIPAICDAVKTFQGVKRRQEIRGVKNGIVVMDDFAHHPTAVRETILAVKPFFPEGRVIAVFEPRTNSSMRSVFQKVYPSAFDGADRVLIRRPSRFDKVPEPERLQPEMLMEDIRARGIDALLFDDTEGLIENLVDTADKGDLLLIMSNGGFDNIHSRLLKAL